MYNKLLVFLCKILIKTLRLFGKNGSALPGLIIEKLSSEFLKKILQPVEDKVVLITGTNGKTTTTKMLVAGARGAGLSVVTNATGSNMTRGLIAALVEDMTIFGKLRPTDWFIFEMDEAYGPIFTESISPRVVVGLNVLRDQLDRYGEIDTTAKLIQETAKKSSTFIFNQEDPLLKRVSMELNTDKIKTVSFGVSQMLQNRIVNEQVVSRAAKSGSLETHAAFELTGLQEGDRSQRATVANDGRKYTVNIPAKGFHNAFNLAAVIACLQELDVEITKRSLDAIENMPIPFGRGEELQIKGKSITVGLVKNPSGFIANLETFVDALEPDVVLFVVNDKLADGRDVSWLWDVPFRGRISKKTKVLTSGIRAYDMAVRLKHDGIVSEATSSVTVVVKKIMLGNYSNVVIIPTYTALFEVRAALAKYGKVPRIW